MSQPNDLSEAVIEQRRNAPRMADRVMFGVKALYGLSRQSIDLPLNETEKIESGQICLTIDPEADETTNIGIIDYRAGLLKVRYGAQAVFPGLHRLVADQKFEPSLLDQILSV